MKTLHLRLVLACLFALSIGAAGAMFTSLILAQPAFAASCPNCELIDVACPGSPCNCVWDSFTSQYETKCQPPTQ